jgi:hypothetical protein
MVAYEVLGKTEYFNTAMLIQNDLIWLQNGADGQISSDLLNGALWHYGRQHSWDWDEDKLGASPWMSALVIDAALRNYAFTENTEVADFIYKMGDFFIDACPVSESSWEGVRYPVYAYMIDGTSENNEWEDPYHAVDVGVSLAWSYYFSQLLGKTNQNMLQISQELYETYKEMVNYWTRPSGPDYQKTQFRVSPWRKYNWEHRISGSYPWLLFGDNVTSVDNSIKSDQDKFYLLQNYPNPFNPVTTITYSIPPAYSLMPKGRTEAGFVTLKIYNLLGQEVATLVNGNQPAGTYKVKFDAANFSSGVYFYKIKAGEFVDIKRMMLLK